MLGVFALIAILNNFHSHQTMQTTASSFNTKFYFVTRTFLQLLYIYLSVTLILGYSLIGKKLTLTENGSEVDSLRVICCVVTFFSFVIFIVLFITASKLIKIKSRTEFDQIRT